MTRIFIPEEIPSLNKGEAAVLIGALESFKTLGDIEVSLLSSRPEIDRIRYTEEIKIIDGMKGLHLSNILVWGPLIAKAVRFMSCTFQHALFAVLYKIFGSNATKIMKAEIWKEYTESDLIIIGHANAIIISSQLYIVPFVKSLGKPIIIYAGGTRQGGVGNNGLWKMLASIILNKLDLILLRDDISYAHLKAIGVDKPPIYVTADLAFLLRPASSERVIEIMSQENIGKSRPIIGIVTRGIMFHYSFPNLKSLKQKYDRCVKMMAQVVDYLTNTLNATVVFIPHCFNPSEGLDDRAMAKDICQTAENKDNVKLITNEYSPEELKGLIGQLDLLVSARTHPIIGAASMHVPFVTISCPPHQRGYGIIGKMLGQQEWICSIETVDSEELISKIDSVWSARDGIKKELIPKVEVAKKCALKNAELLREILNISSRCRGG